MHFPELIMEVDNGPLDDHGPDTQPVVFHFDTMIPNSVRLLAKRCLPMSSQRKAKD